MKKISLILLALGTFAFAYAASPVAQRAANLKKAGAVHAKVVKQAVAADPIALTGMDGIEFGYYPSFSKEGAINYALTMYNSDEESDYLPQVSLDIYTAKKGEVVGEFSVAKNNLGTEYSALYIAADNEEGYEELAIEDASCTVTLAADKYTIKGSVTAEGGQVYTFEVTAEGEIYDAEHPYEPETPQTLDMNVASAEIDASAVSYGYIDILVETADALITLEFFTSDAKATTIPDGTFQVSDDDEAENVFYAGAFFSMYNMPIGSYAETEDAYYYITEGSVKVESVTGGKKITADVKSFYGTPIKFECTVAVTAIENVTVDAKASKVVENGQIYIIRDGKMYNVLGAAVK